MLKNLDTSLREMKLELENKELKRKLHYLEHTKNPGIQDYYEDSILSEPKEMILSHSTHEIKLLPVVECSAELDEMYGYHVVGRVKQKNGGVAFQYYVSNLEAFEMKNSWQAAEILVRLHEKVIRQLVDTLNKKDAEHSS